MEILSSNIYEKESEIEFKYGNQIYVFLFKNDVEKSYSDCFNPGSLYGYYEKFSGYIPIDIELETIHRKICSGYALLKEESFISEVTFETYVEIVNELETYIKENYDNN